MFDVLDVGASSLQAQKLRINTVAQNIANMNTTRNAAGQAEPYRRRFVLFQPGTASNPKGAGVHAVVKEDKSPFTQRYEPTNPDANPATGMVKCPNVDLAIEQVNAMEASRAYEATISMMDVTKSMFNASLRLIA